MVIEGLEIARVIDIIELNDRQDQFARGVTTNRGLLLAIVGHRDDRRAAFDEFNHVLEWHLAAYAERGDTENLADLLRADTGNCALLLTALAVLRGEDPESAFRRAVLTPF